MSQFSFRGDMDLRDLWRSRLVDKDVESDRVAIRPRHIFEECVHIRPPDAPFTSFYLCSFSSHVAVAWQPVR